MGRQRSTPALGVLTTPLRWSPSIHRGWHLSDRQRRGAFRERGLGPRVSLAAFALGRFPVTNAEWRCFMAADGYEDERWWETESASRWRRGEGTAEGLKQEWRESRQSLRDNPERIRQRHSDGRITPKQAEDWEKIRVMPRAAPAASAAVPTTATSTWGFGCYVFPPSTGGPHRPRSRSAWRASCRGHPGANSRPVPDAPD